MHIKAGEMMIPFLGVVRTTEYVDGIRRDALRGRGPVLGAGRRPGCAGGRRGHGRATALTAWRKVLRHLA